MPGITDFDTAESEFTNLAAELSEQRDTVNEIYRWLSETRNLNSGVSASLADLAGALANARSIAVDMADVMVALRSNPTSRWPRARR